MQEWSVEPVRDWDGLQAALDGHPLQPLTDQKFERFFDRCDIWPSDFGPSFDEITARRVNGFHEALTLIERRSQGQEQQAWSEMFFVSYDRAQRCTPCYHSNHVELRVPPNFWQPQPTGFNYIDCLGGALSPATAAALAERAKYFPLDHHAPLFGHPPRAPYFETWSEVRAMALFWFEMLQRAARCEVGLLIFYF